MFAFTNLLQPLRCWESATETRILTVLSLGHVAAEKPHYYFVLPLKSAGIPNCPQMFIPIVFAEESYGISTSDEFWLEALSCLANQTPPESDDHNLRLTFKELNEVRNDRTFGKRCLGTLLDYADRRGKKLVLIVENLDMMFREMADPNAGWNLRQTLQTEPRVVLLAGATSRFDEIDQPDRAFYDLFVTHALRPLSIDECAVLWEKRIGKTPIA